MPAGRQETPWKGKVQGGGIYLMKNWQKMKNMTFCLWVALSGEFLYILTVLFVGHPFLWVALYTYHVVCGSPFPVSCSVYLPCWGQYTAYLRGKLKFSAKSHIMIVFPFLVLPCLCNLSLPKKPLFLTPFLFYFILPCMHSSDWVISSYNPGAIGLFLDYKLHYYLFTAFNPCSEKCTQFSNLSSYKSWWTITCLLHTNVF